MLCPPYVLRWMNGLCYWVLLSKDGMKCVTQSAVGFPSEAEAKSHFNYLFTNR